MRQKLERELDGQDSDDGEGESMDGSDANRRSWMSTASMDFQQQYPPPHRPNAVSAISTHPSQIGYLTTSSPLVQAAHLPEPQSLEVQSFELASRSSTFNPQRPGSVGSDSQSSLSSRSKTGLVPPAKEQKRSPSPVGKFKGVFSRSSRRNLAGSPSTSPSTSPERKAARANEETRGESTLDLTQSQTDVSQLAASSTSTLPPAAAKPSDRTLSKSSTTSNPISLTHPPATPPNTEPTGPVIVNTPPTPTDHQAPTFTTTSTTKKTTDAATSGSSPWGTLTAYKRARSGSAGPSKLSNTTFAPLTPTVESPPANGATSPGSGFFSSMLTAAQNAANQLTNTIQTANNNTNGPQKNRNITATRDEPIQEEDNQVEVESPLDPSGTQTMNKEPAVKTLGDGELTLNQLGIVDPPSVSGTPLSSKFPDLSEQRARSESAPADTSSATSHEYTADENRGPATTRSLYEPGGPGDRTPPPASVYEDKLGTSGVYRSGSVRSSAATNGHRRNRGSSTTTRGTGTTIGAAIAAANASVAHPSQSQQRLTGFAVSSKKRNRDFHTLFKSVPDDDYLIEDYSCALHREILAHGRLYVSEGHLCFSSNILGWTTTLVMSFDEIVSVEKRSTALVFKNGLMISTLHAKHNFASFTSRDSTYDLIVNIWKLGHPSLKSSLNGVQLEGTGGDKTEKVNVDDMGETAEAGHTDVDSRSLSGSEDDSEDGDDVYDEDDDDDDLVNTQSTGGAAESDADKVAARKVSAAAGTNGAIADAGKDTAAAVAAVDFPGPATHSPTECGDADTHYDKIIGNDVIAAPLGKVYNLLFGPASVTFMSKWLTNEAKCWDLQMEDKKGLSADNKTRVYSYMKPLPGSIGPSKTKCIVTETIESIDLEKAVNVIVSTQTPDVPSGNAFTVKTKYCLSWAEGNATKFHANCTVEWSAKSWLKGPITSAAGDGQTNYCTDLCTSVKAAVSSRPRSGTGSNSGAQKKKRGKKGRNGRTSADAEEVAHAKHTPKQDWGLFEVVRPILGPIFDILQPLLTGNVVYGLLVGLLVAAWFGFGFPSNKPQHGISMYGYPDRLAAYEEMWRREETELWDWLEERVGLERLNDGRVPTKRKPIEPRTVEEKIREERMDAREIQEAIRVTEEKLMALKGVMDSSRKKSAEGGKPSASEA
ncbi:GRAM domain-containing protein [Plectosphaerella plurivora]|uniref:GRAM domain-containing protein n=1 Tax=Plectosphaerella plurivora TaxID=936078 RepID=A0A9P8VAE0_9PEZI|nr:GRAM domain-containing protein [Plectosphaerella plurivora]